MPDADRLGCRAWSTVASSLELGFAFGDEASKCTDITVLVEESFVADHNEFYHLPLAPGDDVCNLRACSINALAVDKDAENKLEPILLAGIANILKTRAVGGVETDSGEACRFDSRHV